MLSKQFKIQKLVIANYRLKIKIQIVNSKFKFQRKEIRIKNFNSLINFNDYIFTHRMSHTSQYIALG